MKEHIYKMTSTRYLRKSALLWGILVVQIAFSILFSYTEHSIITLIIWNVMTSSTCTIPGFIIHSNYLRASKNASFTIRYNNVSYTTPQGSLVINSAEIVKVILHSSPSTSRYVWWDYSWFELIDIHGNSIKINCYIMEIGTLWLDSLSRKIGSKKLERIESYFPLMPE